jgi:EAL domain-containing protein (putative c-di-GMP-specific phosphodiesterase class I)
MLARLQPCGGHLAVGGVTRRGGEPVKQLRTGTDAGEVTSTLPDRWDCRPLLAGAEDLTVVFQPIVDLSSASVAGYRTLCRFPGTAAPEVWFAAAEEAGLRAELEALALRRALAALPDLPPHTFLTVPLSAHLLGRDAVVAALTERPTLRRLVVELTADLPTPDLALLRRQVAALRGRGALVALTGAGCDAAALQQLAEVRPQLVTLDRTLFADPGPVADALGEVVRTVTRRIDAWLLADGVESTGDLAGAVRLGAGLASGWLLGHPAPSFAPLPPEVVRQVRAQAARARLADSVASLLRPVRYRGDGDAGEVLAPCVLLSRTDVPVGLVLVDPRTGATYRAPVSLRVPPSAGVAETLQRALSRPPVHRFDPVVCTDRAGAVLGLLRVEDLASAAAAG